MQVARFGKDAEMDCFDEKQVAPKEFRIFHFIVLAI